MIMMKMTKEMKMKSKQRNQNEKALNKFLILSPNKHPNNIPLILFKEPSKMSEQIEQALKRSEDEKEGRLDLYNQRIGDNGAKYLADVLKINTSITSIDLWSNNIGDDGAKYLADALKTNTSITNIYLGPTILAMMVPSTWLMFSRPTRPSPT
jgi:hypothetical protein